MNAADRPTVPCAPVTRPGPDTIPVMVARLAFGLTWRPETDGALDYSEPAPGRCCIAPPAPAEAA